MRRARTIVLVGLLMLSLAAPMTATVAAQDYEPGDTINSDEQDNLPEGYYAEIRSECARDKSAFDLLHRVNQALDANGLKGCYVIRDATVTDQTTANYAGDQIKTDITAGLNEADNRTSGGDVLDDTLAEGQGAFASSLSNNSSKAEAVESAKKQITQEVLRKMTNDLVAENNKMMTRLGSLAESPGVNFSAMNYNGTYSAQYDVFPTTSYDTNVSYDFVTNENGAAKSLFNSYGPSTNKIDPTPNTGSSAYADENFPSTITYDDPEIADKDIGTDAQVDNFRNTWNSYKDARSAAVSELQSFASNLSDTEYDNLSASDVIDRRQAASEWAEKYNDTGSIGYAALLAADSGYTIPGNVTTKYMVNLSSTDTVDYNGTIFGAPGAWSATNNSIETGYQYDGGGQTAWVLTLNGEQKTLDQPYTVEKITLKDGTTVNETAMREPSDDYFANTSAYRENLELYQELMNESQQLPDGSGGTGDGLFGGGLFGGDGPLGVPWIAWLIGAVLVGAVVLGDD